MDTKELANVLGVDSVEYTAFDQRAVDLKEKLEADLKTTVSRMKALSNEFQKLQVAKVRIEGALLAIEELLRMP